MSSGAFWFGTIHRNRMAAVPSWLAAMGHAKDRLWSVDLFRAESILLKSHWILVVMDVYIRRILGFGVATANLDGIQVCRMFNWAIARQTMPRHLSSDHDPLFRFQRWRATNRNYSARVFGSNLVLAAERSRTEARGLQDVLQPTSVSHRAGRSDARTTERRTRASARATRLISLASPLQGLVSDSGRRVMWNSPHTGQVSRARFTIPPSISGEPSLSAISVTSRFDKWRCALASGSADTALLEILRIAEHFSEIRAEAPGDSDPPIVQLRTVRRSRSATTCSGP